MVIQRWQSVFLLLAAILMAFYAFMPVAGFTFNGISYELSLLGVESLLPGSDSAVEASVKPEVVSWPLFVLAIIVAVLGLIAIFKFKNLKLQKGSMKFKPFFLANSNTVWKRCTNFMAVLLLISHSRRK